MTSSFHRPMKAVSLLSPEVEHSNDNIFEAISSLKKWPVYGTIKKDGIRGLRTTDLFSATLHLIPNVSVRQRSMKLPYGFDCELFNPLLDYDEIESIVMSEKHERSHLIQFHCLDLFDPVLGYLDRYRKVYDYPINTDSWSDVVFNFPVEFGSPETLMDFFLHIEESNGEGICFRTGDSPYKQGHSTLREQYLIKLCRYVREEVAIIGFIEQQANTNSSKRNPIGMMDRSSFKSGMLGKGTLGSFIVRDKEGLEFKVGTGVGLTDERRLEIWLEQEKWLGKQITIKHKAKGRKIKPRHPIYCGKREDI